MEKRKFDLLYETVLSELNSLDEYECEIVQELQSFEQFKHFCKLINLMVELDSEKVSDKMRECSLYFMKETNIENKPIRFDFYNQSDPNYYLKFKDIFDKLIDYKKHYIVTLNRRKNFTNYYLGLIC